MEAQAIDVYFSSTLFGVPIRHLDAIAFLFFYFAWAGYARYADYHYHSRPNLMVVMNNMRKRWMRELLKRENRIADASLMGNLLRSISFFANTSIFILAGLITLIGYRDSVIDAVRDLPYVVPTTTFVWELKLFNLMVIFVYAFFKFTWSLRQYNYSCVLVGAAPYADEKNSYEDYADKAGNLLTNAASHFNTGLRSYYFGMAAITWFLNPIILMAATALVVFVVYRREFLSNSLNSLEGLDEVA
ncbi:MAG: DUF599 domain-containing protein [Rickettsiales bacterium]|nr:DUF599 domain-containing protein [Rickettsiales bacterium]